MRAGASGFLLKDAATTDVLAAIRTIAKGESVIAPTATRRLIDRFVPKLRDPQQQRDNAAQLGALTDREREVFDQMAMGRSNREIAHDLHFQRAP